MYLNQNRHYLSRAIMISALIRLSGSIAGGLFRMLLRSGSPAPDLLNSRIALMEMIIGIVEIILMGLVFYASGKHLEHDIRLIDPEESAEVGRLQEELLGSRLSSLSADDIRKLLEFWAIILIAAEVIYQISSDIYRRFISQLAVIIAGASEADFAALYNRSHGFKYLEMLIAILLGVLVTAIFLNDKVLRCAAAGIAVIFLLSFGLLRMQTLNLSGRMVGIVWTSVIYHLTETVGLFLLAVYLSRRYRGL